MSIDDLKALMDGFDPASLLPEMDTVLGRVAWLMRAAVIVGPVLLLVFGLIYLFAAPKEANYFLGYRCFFGMGSIEAWRAAQRLAGLAWSVLGLILLIVMLVLSRSFAEKESMEMVAFAGKCAAWEVGLTALVCIGVNITVACLFDRKGRPRRRGGAAEDPERTERRHENESQ